MPEKDTGSASAEASGFFAKAREAAKESNFDYAIDMYLEGLRRAPDAVKDGHIELRELALVRQAKGGQKPPMPEVVERLKGQTSLEQMLNAEYLLAKDPGHLPYAEALLKAAVAGEYKETAKWIGDLMFLANNGAKRPSVQIYLLLKDSYAAIGRFDRAVAACECAAKLKPDDKDLAAEIKNLSGKRAAAKAKLEQERQRLQFGLEATDSELAAEERQEEKTGAEQLAKAGVFFERAQKVAWTNNFDYAIDMYLEGLRCGPDALEDGHLPLREIGLLRQGKGGKKPSVVEKVKRLRGKTPLERMLNAEYLFAKDPDHLHYAEEMITAAVEGGYKKTAKWIADLVFQANNAAKKPSLQTYILLKDAYKAIGQFERAIVACQHAARLKPEDGELADEFKNLTAELTVARGRYDQEGDFRKSIKDRETQEKLHAQESVVKTEDYRASAVEEARKAFAQDSNLPKNIFDLSDTLTDLETDQADKEAIELLENAYEAKSDFNFKERAGRVRIKQLKRRLRKAKAALEANPNDTEAKSKVAEFSTRLNNTELEHYRLCVVNYPTDLRAKYEYGVRLMRNKQHDQAIPLFQEAQRDPRHKISAMGKIGLAFFMKGWFADAIDVLIQAIDSYEIKDDAIGKELRYNLARSYEERGDIEKALEIYRKIAQLDFAYKDVRQRVDELRTKETGPASA